MQRVTVKNNLSIQFDLDQITSGDVEKQIQQAINQINGVLQRGPMGLGASITLNYGPTTELEYDVEDIDSEEEDNAIDDSILQEFKRGDWVAVVIDSNHPSVGDENPEEMRYQVLLGPPNDSEHEGGMVFRVGGVIDYDFDAPVDARQAAEAAFEWLDQHYPNNEA